jgi:two-component system KDP operon response regulator KdpE
MSEPSVLIVDDDAQICRFLKAGFMQEGFKVFEERSGKGGIKHAALRPADLVVVDLNLGDIDGLEVVRRVREGSTVPIIVLSVRASDDDKVSLLESGADDYVVKPFSMAELVARCRAALRRHTRPHGNAVLRAGDLVIDLANRNITLAGRRIVLSPKEYRLLQVLAQHNGNVVTHDTLLTEIWGARSLDQGHYLRILVRRLRGKIEPNPKQPQILMSELGVGYRLVVAP